jgi:hypothetical protein
MDIPPLEQFRRPAIPIWASSIVYFLGITLADASSKMETRGAVEMIIPTFYEFPEQPLLQ